jgi:hypothetical protein
MYAGDAFWSMLRFYRQLRYQTDEPNQPVIYREFKEILGSMEENFD